MNIKIVTTVIFFANLLAYSSLFASETCDTVTEEKINQFVEIHRDDWSSLLTSKFIFVFSTCWRTCGV